MCPPRHLHGNQGAGGVPAGLRDRTGHGVRWAYMFPSAWGPKGLGPLPAWCTHLQGGLRSRGHPCPCLHGGLCEDRMGWGCARPHLQGVMEPRTSLPVRDRGGRTERVGTLHVPACMGTGHGGDRQGPLMSHQGRESLLSTAVALGHLAPGMSPGGKAGDTAGACVHVRAQVWDFLGDIQGRCCLF